jgi:RNA polymerase sigma-70 factor (ECF subfamily)
LATARRLLARRLRRRGLVEAGAALAAVLAPEWASAAVPGPLAACTAQAVSAVLAGSTAASVVSAKVLTLTEGVLNAMLLTKLKLAALVVLAVLVAGGGLTLSLRQTLAADDAKKPPAKQTPPKEEAKPKPDAEKLQGTWAIVSAERGGVAVPDDVKKWKTIVKDDKWTVWFTETQSKESTFKLDPAATPRGIDITGPEGGVEAGIYKLEGDKLTICYELGPDSKRPGEFRTEPGSKQVLLVLQRQPEPGK